MAASTFAALFLAHVLADYVLQTRWMVVNKHRASAMATHIGTVFATMCLTTLSVSVWFIALALAHLAIDLLKTRAMPDGLFAYVFDQILHIASILAIAALAPGLWAASPLADIAPLPMVYMIAAGVLFAVRGGQFAVTTVRGPDALDARGGVLFGWGERAALCGALIYGLPLAALAIVAAKAVFVATQMRGRDATGRRRLCLGALISLAFGLAVAVPLTLALPLLP